MPLHFDISAFDFSPSTTAPTSHLDRRCFVVAEVNLRCELLLCDTDAHLQLLSQHELEQRLTDAVSSEHYLGQLNAEALWVVVIKNAASIKDGQWLGLRSQLGAIDENIFLLAGRALQVAQWFYDHRFCGRCSIATEFDGQDRAKVCHHCNLRFYPRISPCMIALVTRGDELLLAHHARASRPIYTTLAGFVEPGERVEDTVHREVMEEVGITLGKLDYFFSQPWPFPGQLMLGFFAEYQAGEIIIDGTEILDAKWFRYDQLPQVPPKATVAGQLIDHYVNQRIALQRS